MHCPACGKEMDRYVYLGTDETFSWVCPDCDPTIEIDAMDLTDEELAEEEGAGG